MHSHLWDGRLGDPLGIHGHHDQGLVLVGLPLACVGQEACPVRLMKWWHDWFGFKRDCRMLDRPFLHYALACIPFVIHILVPLITRSPPTLLAEVVRASFFFEIFLLNDKYITDRYLAKVLSDKWVFPKAQIFQIHTSPSTTWLRWWERQRRCLHLVRTPE